MRKARFLLATAFILGLSAMAPRAEAARCFQEYVKAVESCSQIRDWVDNLACGGDAVLTLAGCIRGTLLG